jgi:hypothetical protein
MMKMNFREEMTLQQLNAFYSLVASGLEKEKSFSVASFAAFLFK